MDQLEIFEDEQEGKKRAQNVKIKGAKPGGKILIKKPDGKRRRE